MTITTCPRCGSMNITTAGVCANCGWSQFAQVTTVSTRITGEIEIMLSGKALLDDYKRLLLENRNLKEHIAELEAERKEFCPNCEAETPCTHEAELFVCDICGEDFAKYIVSRSANVSDVSTTDVEDDWAGNRPCRRSGDTLLELRK